MVYKSLETIEDKSNFKHLYGAKTDLINIF